MQKCLDYNNSICFKRQYDNDINKSLKKSMEYIIENKNVEVIDICDAGHLANIEKPQEYTNIILNLIDKYLSSPND